MERARHILRTIVAVASAVSPGLVERSLVDFFKAFQRIIGLF